MKTKKMGRFQDMVRRIREEEIPPAKFRVGNNGKTYEIQAVCCWCCGGYFEGYDCIHTKHHAIPRALKPIRNVLLPICKRCHKKINKNYSKERSSKETK